MLMMDPEGVGDVIDDRDGGGAVPPKDDGPPSAAAADAPPSRSEATMNGHAPIVAGTEPSAVENSTEADAGTSADPSSAVARAASATWASSAGGADSSTGEEGDEEGDDDGSVSSGCSSVDDLANPKRPQQDPSSPSSAAGAYTATVTTCSESASSSSGGSVASATAVSPPPIRSGLIRKRGRRQRQDATSPSSGKTFASGWGSTLASAATSSSAAYGRLRNDFATATSTPLPDETHRQLTDRIYAQMELLALSTAVTLGLLLYLILGLVGNVLLASAFASFLLLLRTTYTCALLELGDTRRTVRDNGVISYLPESMSAYLTTTTLNEWMTDSTMFLEWRFLLVYFIPGLSSEQLSDLVQRLPPRRRELLFGTGFVRQIFLPESWDSYLFPPGDPRARAREGRSTGSYFAIGDGNGDGGDEEEEGGGDFDDGRLLLHDEDGGGASSSSTAVGGAHAQLAAGGPPTDLVWPDDDDSDNAVHSNAANAPATATGSSAEAADPPALDAASGGAPAAPVVSPVGPTPEEEEQDGRVLAEATQTVVNYVTGSVTVLISSTVEYAVDASLPYVAGGGVALSFAAGVAGFVGRRGWGWGGSVLGHRSSLGGGGGGGAGGGGGGGGGGLSYTLALFSFAMLGSAGGMYALRSYLGGVAARATYTRDHSLPPPTPPDEAAEGREGGGARGGSGDDGDDGDVGEGGGDGGAGMEMPGRDRGT